MQSSSSFQMNSLIMNQRPLPPTKIYTSNLSKAATQFLFPIREQKLLLMFPQDRQFAQARVTITLQEVSASQEDSIETPEAKSNHSSPKKVS